ncbi:MAG: fructose-6-phosphate aldolase [Cytophagales bacterium]|nr:fructose-6-phosphate aldolase [Cytophagales bacterium]
MSSSTFFIVKVRSSSKIPDFFQVRDQNFVLQGYYRLDRPFKDYKKFSLEGKEDAFLEFLSKTPFGVLKRLAL